MSESTALFPDPSRHPDWIQPHSEEWYARLASETDEYKYPWKSQFDEPTAESLFKEKIASLLTTDSRVLDVGCGHGEFTLQFVTKAKEVVGIDKRESFIATANRINTSENARFVTVDVDNGLPFPDNEFDLIYTKKGPWMFGGAGEGNRVIKPGGFALGLYHGGSDGGLRTSFNGLYQPSVSGNPLEAGIKQTYEDHQNQGLFEIDVQGIEEIEYLSTPEDVLIKKCFGQSKSVKKYVWETCLSGVEEIFDKNATTKGLSVINYHYMVTARVI
jgi:SAM-dependent methyltransferase